MTQQQYDAAINSLYTEYEQKKKKVAEEYAFANNPYKIGDVISDHIGTIIIEKIRFSFPFGSKYPCCVYVGTQLKKDGTPHKRQEYTKIFQTNIVKP